jgi:hypothetical protein
VAVVVTVFTTGVVLRLLALRRAWIDPCDRHRARGCASGRRAEANESRGGEQSG